MGAKASTAAKTGKSKALPRPKAKLSARVPAVKLTASQKLDAVGIEAICAKVAECVTLQVIADECGVTKWDLLRYVNSDLHHDAHARARERGADKHAEDILAIADEVHVEAKYDGEDVRLALDATAVARNRLRVDTRKWLAAKMNAKKYGDKVAIGGAEDLPAIQSVHSMSTDALLAIAKQAGKP
jgi:hypothetical protein